MSGDEIRTRLVIEPDQQAADKSEKAIADIEKSLAKAGAAAKKYSAELDKSATSSRRLSQTNTQLKDVANAADKASIKARELNRDLNQAAGTGLRDATGQAENLANQLDRAAANAVKINTTTAKADFGGAAGNLGKISSFAGSAGLGGAGEVGGIAAGLLDVADAAPKLTKNIGETAKAAANSVPVIGALAGGIQSAVPGLGAAGASLTAIGIVALPLVAAVGALTLGLGALSKANKEAADRAKEYVEAISAGAGTFADITTQLADGNVEGARQSVTALQAEQRRREIEIGRIREELAAAEEARAQEQAARQGVGGFIQDLADGVGLVNTTAEETVNGLRDRLEELESQTGTTNQQIADAIRAFDEAGASIVALANDTSALATQQELATAEDELAATRTRAAQTIASLNEQESALLARAQETERLLAEDRGVASARAQEDLERQQERQAQDLAKKLTDIQQRSNDTILSIRTAAIEAEKQLIQGNVDALAKITADEQKKLADVNKSFFAGEIAATKKFRDEVAKADAAFAKQRARRLDDLNDQLLSAEQANDVTAFIAAQRAAEKDLSRQQEDLDEQSRARQESFIAERQAARAELTSRIADIQTESAALRSERAASFTEEMAALKTNTAARITEEKRAVVERLAQEKQAAAERQKLDDENRAIQQRRAQEDQQRQDQRRQDALRAQLDEIERKRQAEQTAIDDLIARIAQLQQVISQIRPPQQLTQTTANRTSQTGNMASLFGRFNSTIDEIRRGGRAAGGGTSRPIPFSEGGIITSPFQGMVRMAEREPEAIVPLSRLGGMGNVNVPVSISGVSFSGAGSGEIEAVLQSVVEVIQQNVITAVETARSRPVMR